MLGLGIGALGGGYVSTDIGKVTTLAMLDAFRKLVTESQSSLSHNSALPASTAVIPAAGQVSPPKK